MKFQKLIKADEQDQVKILEDNLSKLHGLIEMIKMGHIKSLNYFEDKESEVEDDLKELNFQIKFILDKYK